MEDARNIPFLIDRMPCLFLHVTSVWQSISREFLCVISLYFKFNWAIPRDTSARPKKDHGTIPCFTGYASEWYGSTRLDSPLQFTSFSKLNCSLKGISERSHICNHGSEPQVWECWAKAAINHKPQRTFAVACLSYLTLYDTVDQGLRFGCEQKWPSTTGCFWAIRT